MFDHLLESSHRDDSNKWSNIGFGQETKELRSIEINFTHLIWSSGQMSSLMVEVIVQCHDTKGRLLSDQAR